MAYLIGTDIGTSGTKTVLFDESGKTIASSLALYPLYQPQIGWAEQEPSDWWDATVKTINEVILKSKIDVSEIKGIGLSGQMHGLVLLDKDGKVLRKSIIWCDQRTEEECKEISSIIGEKRLIEITANPALTGFTASKIMWVKKHEPEIWEKTAKILLPKDYIRYMLSQTFATEVSDASGMQLMDIKNRCWSDEVLTKLGIEKDKLAPLYESCVVSAQVSKSASDLTMLKEGTLIVGGAGDQAACAIGNGIVKPGVVSSTIGTSGVVFAFTDKLTIAPGGQVHTLCHAVPGTWHIMGVTQGAGLSLKWFRDNFCTSEIETAALMQVDPYYLMDKEAEKVKTGCDGLIYLPYLMGERSPHLDPNAKGVFFGISAIHTKRDMLRAVMEGVIYSLRDSIEIIKGMGIEVNEIRASGGGGKSPLWRQMQADMFKSDMYTVNSSEGGALGVAILAGVGAGMFTSIEQACDNLISVSKKESPILENIEIYDKYYQTYKALYPTLKNLM